jgi:nitroreductase
MEFSEVVRRRRMVRHYSGRPLSPEVIERVLTSALRAPSAGFSRAGPFWRSLTQQTGHASGRLRRPGWSRTADVVHRGHWGRHSSAAVG